MGICNKEKLEVNAGGVAVPLASYIESSKGVAKLIIKELNKTATGFFTRDYANNKYFITNYHVISKQMVDSKMVIILELYDKKVFEIKLNPKNIQFFKDLDVTMIQINDLKELCLSVKFLMIDLDYKDGYNIYLNKKVFVLGYPFGNDVVCSPGKITSIYNNEFEHDCDTNIGSSGSPIILASNSTVMGIHKAGVIDRNINVGIFIGTLSYYTFN